ncbi:MAG: carboxypeptidase M32 [Pseudomonadota bacterium]
MTPAAAYEALIAHHRRIAALEDAAGLLAWDQETMMPPKGAAPRAAPRGALAAVLHQLRTDPRIPDWIAGAEGGDWPEDARADLREAGREHARAVRVPEALAETLARETAQAHAVWVQARAERDFAAFAPSLARVVELRREEGQHLAGPGEDPYDALLEGFEPGLRAADLEPVFARLRAGLSSLLDRIRGASRHRAPAFRGAFPEAAQLALARDLAGACGYDWGAGRLDLAVHPFSSGSGRDVRITTRVEPDDPSECVFSTLHETGHALYEQGIAPELRGRPSGVHASMSVHESQSRLWENHIGRSAAFAPWLLGRMEIFLGRIGVRSPEALHAAVNRVEPGFIRTAADEAQYDLHILMRFDLERALLSGDLPVEDLEGAWADRFQADFGRRPPHAGLGCLQDVHWSEGLFGYFPTYTLGNLNAAALAQALRRDLPDFDGLLSTGDFAPVLDWLREKVHRHGRVRPAPQLMEAATGAPVDEGPLLAHLEAKFGGLYGL